MGGRSDERILQRAERTGPELGPVEDVRQDDIVRFTPCKVCTPYQVPMTLQHLLSPSRDRECRTRSRDPPSRIRAGQQAQPSIQDGIPELLRHVQKDTRWVSCRVWLSQRHRSRALLRLKTSALIESQM